MGNITRVVQTKATIQILDVMMQMELEAKACIIIIQENENYDIKEVRKNAGPTTTLMDNIKPVLLRYIKDKDGLALGGTNEQSRSAELCLPDYLNG
tara:strand:- start:691 stop:978 length:288 start_codon:yes stop_codon:yes gene_type:complete